MPVIREKRQYDSVRSVGVVRVDSGESRKYSGIAQAAQKLTNLAVTEMGNVAETAAQKSAQELSSSLITTINPKTGNPEALDWIGDNRFIGRKAASAYARVVSDRFQKEIDDQIKKRAGEIALQYENDPFSVEKYEEQMVSFLEGMASGSEENGKKTAYTNYILDQGTQYITTTKLNMMQERNRRERNKLSASISAKNEEVLNSVYQFGFQGKDNNFIKNYIDASVDRNLDGEASGVIKIGSSIGHENALVTAYVNGSVTRIFSKLNGKPYDRARVELAIRTGNIKNLPRSLHDELEDIIPFVDTVNRTSILQQASAMSADIAAVEKQEESVQTELTKQNRRSIEITYEDEVTAFQGSVKTSLINAFNSRDFTKINSALMDASEELNKKLVTYSKRKELGDLKSDTAKSLTQDARRSILEPLLITGFLDKKEAIEDFRRSIFTGIADDNLSDYQRLIVDTINQGVSWYDLDEDRSFTETLLNNIKDPDAIKLKTFAESNDLDVDVTSYITDSKQGFFNAAVGERLKQRVITSKFLGKDDKKKNLARLNFGEILGHINSASEATSRGMNALNMYIQSDGNKDVGLPVELKAIGDRIVSIITDKNRDKVITEINSRTSRIKTEETAKQQAEKNAQETTNNYIQAINGGPNPPKKIREQQSSNIKNELGIDKATLPSSETPKFYEYNRSTISEMLLVPLVSLAQGNTEFTPEESNILLNHWVRLSKDPSVEGRQVVNRFGDLIDGADEAVLRQAATIRMFDNTRSVTQIIADIKNRASQPLAMINYEEVFGSQQSQAAYKYVYNKYEDINIATELAPLASFYAKTGNNKSQIDNLLEEIVDSKYVESEYIIDPSSPVGSFKKSRFSLSRVFPNEDEREEFLRQVETNLPEGYSILGSFDPLSLFEQEEDKQFKDLKRVYLVPYEGVNIIEYYSYYVEPDTKEIKALIIEKDGEDFWPTFENTITSDWRRDKQAQKFEDDQSVALKRKNFWNGASNTIGTAISRGFGMGL